MHRNSTYTILVASHETCTGGNMTNLAMSAPASDGVNLNALLFGDTVCLDPKEKLVVKILGANSQSEIIQIRRQVFSGLSDKEYFYDESDEELFVMNLLGPRSCAIALVHNESIVAYTSLATPNSFDDLDIYGMSQFLQPFGAATDVAYVSGTMVLPEFQGRGLQLKMAGIRYDIGLLLGRQQHFATVALGNYASWRNSMAMGHVVRTILHVEDKKYGRLTRYLMHRGMKSPGMGAEIQWLDPKDDDRQIKLIERGFVGTKFGRFEGLVQMGYQEEIGF
jgi:hypothetical protein